MHCVSLQRFAMATLFELTLCGEDEDYLRQAGMEALDEIARVEDQLSFYRDGSDISEINRRAAFGAVPADPRVFSLLERAAELSDATGGAFDITVAPLLRCWSFVGASGAMPEECRVVEAMELVGMRHVRLDRSNCTVRFDREGVALDLGAIGKGYGVGRAIELLRDLEIKSALLHGGTSTICAIGAPPGAEGWQVAVRSPLADSDADHLATILLRDRALSVSAPHGKFFEAHGRRWGHIIDPRTGYPASTALLAALSTESPTDSDALSTALLTLGPEGIATVRETVPGAPALVAIAGKEGGLEIVQSGFDPV